MFFDIVVKNNINKHNIEIIIEKIKSILMK